MFVCLFGFFYSFLDEKFASLFCHLLSQSSIQLISGGSLVATPPPVHVPTGDTRPARVRFGADTWAVSERPPPNR